MSTAIASKADSLVEAIGYYYDHPVAFVQDIMGAQPEPEQADFLAALVHRKPIAVKSGHGIGKTAAEAWAILWFLSTRPFSRVPCTAPTGHQLDDILWPEVAKWLWKSPLKDDFIWTKTRLCARDHEESWFAVPRSCNRPENLQGFHADELLFVIDEAPGVPQEIMEVVEGAMTNRGIGGGGDAAQLLMTGNPTQLSGTFFNAFHRDRAQYQTFTFSSENSSLVSSEYCERLAALFGKDSDVYRVRVLGQFPKGTSDAFIRLDAVEAAIKREVKAEGAIELGIDPARYGDDKSIICWRRGLQVQPFESFHGINTTRLTGETAKLVRKIRKTGYTEKIKVKVDDTGIGGGVTDQLQELQQELNIFVVPVNFGGASLKPEYADRGAQMWGDIKEALDTIQLPADEELTAELSTRKYKLQPDGKIKLERKEDMKKRGIASPDRGDALCLCFAHGGFILV